MDVFLTLGCAGVNEGLNTQLDSSYQNLGGMDKEMSGVWNKIK
jgi:hypothetical protein